MKPLHIPFVLTLSLVLAACGTNSAIVTNPSEAQPSQADGPSESQFPELIDSQGAVTVIVMPLDLGLRAEKLTFQVTLETHSVDLSMDLVALATLTTDTGYTVQADVWDAPRGGHHVSGTLSYPSSVDGKAILDGATKVTLMIKDVDIPERTFTWDLR